MNEWYVVHMSGGGNPAYVEGPYKTKRVALMMTETGRARRSYKGAKIYDYPSRVGGTLGRMKDLIANGFDWAFDGSTHGYPKE